VRRLAPALLCAAALLVAACGGDDGGGDDAASDTTAAAADTTQLAIQTVPQTTAGAEETTPEETTPENTVDRDATIRVSYSVGPVSFDPSKSSSSFDSPALFLTYDRLVHLDPNATPEPGLAESWEFSEDGLTLTLNLREGVTFHDGTEFNAEAVKANLERNKAGTASGDLAALTEVNVVDDLTVDLVFASPSGQFPAVLADRAGAMASPAAFGDALDLQPVGAGMYKVVEYQKDAFIAYERNEDYWDPDAAAAARLEFQIIQDNVAALNALKSKQVDWGLILPSQAEDAESSGLVVQQGLTLNMHHIQFNRSRPFLDNVEVRRAISMAIDRDGMVEGVLLGRGVSSSQPFPPGYWGHNEEIVIPEFNPDKAREMIAAAGAAGQTYELVAPNTNVYPALAQVIKENLDAVGLNINIRIVDSVQTAPIFYQQAQGDLLVSVFGGRFDPAQHFGLLYTAGPVPNPGAGTWPALDALLPDVTKPGTIEERQDAVRAASKVVSDDAVNVLLHHPAGLFAFDPKVVGSQVWLIGRPEFRGLGIAAG
jgi:peptide/nickel transport system substrate-binding protein